ncbi:SAM-dependent methyltransferase [Amycolatopsis sp. PS_44_ISF1]|uniref:SAM-dependent methyltransferase n=1 Tax=Amycolatopsis sp. PS_44_ISF1 TaxID=2974917 RepID=UPI0028DDA27D|nr:SAM-dependent methyltransferase [Amycolatopsis sp. PS_44_ISF1]MDT8913736.1 SAM-dependent methyltransferase [Amycolatopsis sp. PS_44_ISF1]MDT8916203.1 SAM-dependent methyltransferase [Amycolatopsis sp. PS_44_ISF1]
MGTSSEDPHRPATPIVDIEKPSVARAYDWYLGGSTNTAIDRDFAERAARLIPAQTMALDNRNFLRRVVTYLIDHGIRQFIDIGSGIPTVGNVHEVAASLADDVRVVYIDNDPVAVAQSHLLIDDDPRTTVINADIRDPATILGHTDVRDLLDFDQPIGVLMIAVWHFITDEHHPADTIATYRDALPNGSYLALSHLSERHATAELRARIRDCITTYTTSASPLVPRDPDTLTQWLTGFELLDPSIVPVNRWHPDLPGPDGPDNRLIIGGLAKYSASTRSS